MLGGDGGVETRRESVINYHVRPATFFFFSFFFFFLFFFFGGGGVLALSFQLSCSLLNL